VTPIPDGLWSDLDRQLPVALLPVRIEVRSGLRSVPAPAGGSAGALQIPTLRIRIYPDEISVPVRSSVLRPDETAAGQRFWTSVAAAEQPARGEELVDTAAVRAAQMSAWEVLTREVGVDRAPHVARVTRPGAAPEVAPAGPASAVLLPDAWVVFGHVGGVVVLTAHVAVPTDSVQMGPSGDLGVAAFAPGEPQLMADPELRWMTDFDEAERRGMALTVDLVTPDEATTGPPSWVAAGHLDSLVVIGVRGAGATDPAAEAVRLAGLFAAHGAVDRVAIVPAGTPTNRIAGRAPGWTSALDPFGAFDRVVGASTSGPPAGPGPVDALEGAADTTAADALAVALGVDRGTFAGVEGADDAGLTTARDMAIALFPVTFGEALRTLLVPESIDAGTIARLDAALDFARDHVSRFVRGRGSLPVLRVGRQPYGVLPITPLSQVAPNPSDPSPWARLVGVLRLLRPFWEQAVAAVPTLQSGTSAPDAASRIIRVLQQGPVPHPAAYVARTTEPTRVFSSERSLALPWRNAVFGPLVRAAPGGTAPPSSDLTVASTVVAAAAGGAASLGAAVSGDLDPAAAAQAVTAAISEAARSAAAVAAVSAIVDRELMGFDGFVIGGPDPVVTGSDLPAAASGRGLVRIPATAEADPFGATPTGNVLSLLLTLSAALDTERGDATVLAGLKADFDRRRGEYAQRITDYNRVASAAAAGDIPPPGFEQEQRLDLSLELTPLDLDSDGPGAFWYELAKFHAVPDPLRVTPAIGRLAGAGLDASGAARLTGETVACASTRFDAWATSIATRRLATQRSSRPTGVQLGCWSALVDVSWPAVPTDVPGPATWAAADRSGTVRRPLEQVGYVHAPSLDHARTAGVLRAAERAHRGDASTLTTLNVTSRRTRAAREVLQTVGNGVDLGAVLGSHLERALADAGLQRCVAPLRAAFPQHRRQGAAGTPVAPGDDHVPLDDVVDGLDVWQGRAGVAAICPDGGDALQAVLADLDDLVDAVADVLVAQGVHDLVGGRPTRAGATFGALAGGDRPPLDLDVLTTPRSATTITHRVLLSLGADAPSGWNRDTARARLAPALERWVEGVLGEPGAVRVRVTGRAADGTAIDPVVVDLADLGRSALDVVTEVDTSGDDGFVRRLGAHAGVVAGLAVSDDGAWTRLRHLAEGVRAVLGTARPATTADVGPGPQLSAEDPTGPTQPAEVGAPALAPLVASLAAELQRLQDAVGALGALDRSTPDAPVADGMLDALVDLGIPGAIRAAGTATIGAVAGAVDQAAGVLGDIAKAIGDTASAPEAWSGRVAAAVAGAADPLALLVDLARRLAGDAVVPSPDVATVPANAILAADAAAPAEVEAWLERTGRVRDRLAAYDDLRMFVEATGGRADPLVVAQLPADPAVGWLGGRDVSALGDRDAPRPDRPTTHLVIAGAAGPSALVLDELIEVLPEPEVTTGLAVHYDAPAARPPQSILLAVHPGSGAPWGPGMLDDVVTEALALARLRLVELEDLASTGLDAFLPLTAVRAPLVLAADPPVPAVHEGHPAMLVPAGTLPGDVADWGPDEWKRWAEEQEEMAWLAEAATAAVDRTAPATVTGTETVTATGTATVTIPGSETGAETGSELQFAQLQRAAHRVAGPAAGAETDGSG
jgi:hypothetical protein